MTTARTNHFHHSGGGGALGAGVGVTAALVVLVLLVLVALVLVLSALLLLFVATALLFGVAVVLAVVALVPLEAACRREEPVSAEAMTGMGAKARTVLGVSAAEEPARVCVCVCVCVYEVRCLFISKCPRSAPSSRQHRANMHVQARDARQL
jgi:hypothetical protein